MTDLPRRSYPLVVPPPGGFEDAVRRGRGLRRRRAGSSTGAALALAGVMAYSLMHGGNVGSNGLQPTRRDPVVEQPVPGGVRVPPDEVVATTRPVGTTTDDRTAGGGTAPRVSGPVVTGPSAPPAGNVPRRPSGGRRPTAGPTLRYAARAAIVEDPQPTPNTAPDDCLPSEGKVWCARALATAAEGAWDLTYTLCRRIDAEPGLVQFDRTQEADYAVVHVDSGETIWTYSAGQAVTPAAADTSIPAGHCVSWTTRWNGYDDFGYTPPTGNYRLTALSTGKSDTTLPTERYDFRIDSVM